MDIQIVIALIALAASVFGGMVVAVINHLFTKKRTEAEIEKLKADTQKTLAETENIRRETKHAIGEVSYYDSTKTSEVIIYDGRKNFRSYDITAEWSEYTVQQGVIVIPGDAASFELRTYMYNGKETTFIPKNELLSGYRKLHISCELKVISATYEFSVFLMENPDSGESIDDRVATVSESEWITVDFYFRVLPNKNYTVYIFTERVSGDGSIQIRNLVVAERTN